MRLEGASVGRNADVHRRLLPHPRQHHVGRQRLGQARRLGGRPRDRLDRPRHTSRCDADRSTSGTHMRGQLLHARERHRPQRHARQDQPAGSAQRESTIRWGHPHEREEPMHDNDCIRGVRALPRARYGQLIVCGMSPGRVTSDGWMEANPHLREPPEDTMSRTPRSVATLAVVGIFATVAPLIHAVPASAARPKTISIADAAIVGGDAGTKSLAFSVTWTGAKGGGVVSVGYAPADGTATAGSDYT